MSVPLSTNTCSYCRGKLGAADSDGTGICRGCLMDRLLADPSTGIPMPGWDWMGREQGRDVHHYAFLCTRCGGSGHVYAGTRVGDSWCFTCGGEGWILRDREGIQRTARWWETYQKNRTPS